MTKLSGVKSQSNPAVHPRSFSPRRKGQFTAMSIIDFTDDWPQDRVQARMAFRRLTVSFFIGGIFPKKTVLKYATAHSQKESKIVSSDTDTLSFFFSSVFFCFVFFSFEGVFVAETPVFAAKTLVSVTETMVSAAETPWEG